MVNCEICKGPDAQLRVCDGNSSHMAHQECLQDMLNAVGGDIALFKCPSCPSGELLSLELILGYQTLGITVMNKEALVIEYSKRKALASLPSNKRRV